MDYSYTPTNAGKVMGSLEWAKLADHFKHTYWLWCFHGGIDYHVPNILELMNRIGERVHLYVDRGERGTFNWGGFLFRRNSADELEVTFDFAQRPQRPNWLEAFTVEERLKIEVQAEHAPQTGRWSFMTPS
jgi:hypothetical protein